MFYWKYVSNTWRWYWHQILAMMLTSNTGDDADIKYWRRYWHPHYQGQLQEEPLPTGGRCIEHWTLDGELHIHSLWRQKTYYHCHQSLLAMQRTQKVLGHGLTTHCVRLGDEIHWGSCSLLRWPQYQVATQHPSQHRLEFNIQPKNQNLALISSVTWCKHRTTTFEDPRPGGAKEGPKGAYGVPAQYERSFRLYPTLNISPSIRWRSLCSFVFCLCLCLHLIFPF